MIRVPIRLYPRIKDDQIFRPTIKQFTLLLVKRLHESYYLSDYIGLLISYIKRISSSDSNDSLARNFSLLCEKPADKTRFVG